MQFHATTTPTHTHTHTHTQAKKIRHLFFSHRKRDWEVGFQSRYGSSPGVGTQSYLAFWPSLVCLLCTKWLLKLQPLHLHYRKKEKKGLATFSGEGNGTPLQYSCLENPMDGGAWRATVHGVAKSLTRLSDFTFTFHFPALEKEMANHSSVLAWRIPGTGEPGGLPSMGSHRVRHD